VAESLAVLCKNVQATTTELDVEDFDSRPLRAFKGRCWRSWKKPDVGILGVNSAAGELTARNGHRARGWCDDEFCYAHMVGVTAARSCSRACAPDTSW